MISNDFYQLATELNVMDFTRSKPTHANLSRKYDVVYRAVKKYKEGYKGNVETKNKQA